MEWHFWPVRVMQDWLPCTLWLLCSGTPVAESVWAGHICKATKWKWWDFTQGKGQALAHVPRHEELKTHLVSEQIILWTETKHEYTIFCSFLLQPGLGFTGAYLELSFGTQICGQRQRGPFHPCSGRQRCVTRTKPLVSWTVHSCCCPGTSRHWTVVASGYGQCQPD